MIANMGLGETGGVQPLLAHDHATESCTQRQLSALDMASSPVHATLPTPAKGRTGLPITAFRPQANALASSTRRDREPSGSRSL